MLNEALILTVAAGATAQVYPDQLDILRGADTAPQIEMVLDTSCSMGWNFASVASTCAYFYNSVLGAGTNPTYPLNPINMLKAAMTGCQNANDGIIDMWANRVYFGLREFGGNFGGGARIGVPAGGGFSSTLGNGAALEAAILGLSPLGGTPLAAAYAQAAWNIASYWNDANSAQCRQNYIVLMTDGDGNSSINSLISQGAGNAPVIINDWPDNNAWAGALHLARQDSNWNLPVDAMPNVTGVQPIRTYTVGFGANISASGQFLLQAMAVLGDGQYYAAVGYQQLNTAFTQIILSIVARSNVSFSANTVQNDGLFSGNYVYATSFRPFDQGAWFGNVKKHCMMPANPADTSCIFRDDGAGNLIANPAAVDMWTGTNSTNTTVGGAGQVIWSSLMGGATGPTSPVPSSPLWRRNIYTWEPGQYGYRRLASSIWTRARSFARTDCEHAEINNRLHGYTADAVDCAANNYAPSALEQWPLGDFVNGDTVLIKYTATCESAGDRCYLATVGNDGMLHFFDARTGRERSAIIPGHVWSSNTVAIHQMRDLMDQPNLNELRRFFFDGGVRLYHDDQNGNGFVDNGEEAKLIAGLGRGGRSYILWDLSVFFGVPSTFRNPPRELMVDRSSSFRHLRETWAAPWIGRYRHQDGNLYTAAIFPSGHERETDKPNHTIGAYQAGLPPPSPDSKVSPFNRGCPAFFAEAGLSGAQGAMLCNPPIPATPCRPCNNRWTWTWSGLRWGCPPSYENSIFLSPQYCYDWPGWTTFAPPPFNASGGPGVGHDMLLGPFSWSSTSQTASAYRLVFGRLDLQPGDYLAFLDSNQNEVGRLTGPQPNGVRSPWIDDDTFYVRFKTDGFDTAPSTGFQLQRIQMIRENNNPSGVSRPTIYMVDLNRWNGLQTSAATRFARQPGLGDRRQQSGVLLRITSTCEGLQQAGETCLDFNGSAGQPPQPDLLFMRCNISHEPSVLTVGGLVQGIYWGDECGQIFRATRDTSGTWSVRRLLHTNNTFGSGYSRFGRSKDFRKIFANMEIVRSNCNGGSNIGVYFGTGNLQRPALFDNLASPTIAQFPGMQSSTGPTDVFGVVWDHSALPQNAGLDALENVTNTVQTADPRTTGVNGWFVELNDQEKVLRAPLVFDGTAYFRTYLPITPATECVSADGEEFTWAMDNCTARPTADGDGSGTIADSPDDRVVGQTVNDIGGEMAIYTPAGDAPVVDTGGAAPLTTNRARPTRFMMWRTMVDPI